MKVNVIGSTISEAEKQEYIKYAMEKYHERIISQLDIEVDGEYVNLRCEFLNPPFDRIRRITGYLVGSLDRFCDGKKAEEHDRVKHTVSE